MELVNYALGIFDRIGLGVNVDNIRSRVKEELLLDLEQENIFINMPHLDANDKIELLIEKTVTSIVDKYFENIEQDYLEQLYYQEYTNVYTDFSIRNNYYTGYLIMYKLIDFPSDKSAADYKENVASYNMELDSVEEFLLKILNNYDDLYCYKPGRITSWYTKDGSILKIKQCINKLRELAK